MAWLLTCEEYMASVKMKLVGDITWSQKRIVAFVHLGSFNEGLKLLKRYSDAYKRKFMPDGQKGTCLEFRLISATEIPDDFDATTMRELDVFEITEENIQKWLEA